MIDERDIKFPELLILWQNRDLVDHAPAIGDYRHEFYKGFRRRDENRVWRFIGDNYLSRYKCPLVRVGFDWIPDSPWEIPFPGSVMMGDNYSGILKTAAIEPLPSSPNQGT